MARVSSSSSSGNKNVNIPKVNKAVRNVASVPSRPNATANQNNGTSKKEVAWERVSKRLQRTHSATGHLKDTPLSQLMQKNLDDLFEGTRHNLTVKEVYSKELLYFETEDGREAKQMLRRHGIQFIDYFFRYRMICVFQEQDGEEVLFFCMSVKEYRAQKWCTIDYLDSVSLYSGVVFRTKVYEELIYSYFEFARSIGYERVHIFVAALGENKEYFFHKRPTTMRLPEQPMLMSWYMRMLKGGKKRRIVGFIGTERPADGGRVRNQRVKNYIHEISYSEFFRNSIEHYLQSGNFTLKNCISDIEKYPGKHGNQLLYVNFKTAGENTIPIPEETIEYELTKTRSNWLETLKEKNLTFVTREEAKKSTAAILGMLMPGNQ